MRIPLLLIAPVTTFQGALRQFDGRRTRRDVLGLAGVGGSLLVAGCVGSGSASTPAGGSTTDGSTSSADATTSTDTTTDTQPTMSTVFHFAGRSDV